MTLKTTRSRQEKVASIRRTEQESTIGVKEKGRGWKMKRRRVKEKRRGDEKEK